MPHCYWFIIVYWFSGECVNQGDMMDNDILTFLYNVTGESLLHVMSTVHIYSIEILYITILMQCKL